MIGTLFIGGISGLWVFQEINHNSPRETVEKNIQANLVLDSMFSNQYYWIENSNIFPLKDKEVSNTIWKFNKECLQIPGMDMCEAVVMSYEYNHSESSCQMVQTWWCSDWLHSSKNSCQNSCNWIKTSENLWHWFFLINKNVFYYNKPVNGLDKNTFQILDEWLTKDKNYLYIQWDKITRFSLTDVLAIDKTEDFYHYNYSIVTKKWIYKYGKTNKSWENMKYLWLNTTRGEKKLQYFSKDWTIWNNTLRFQNKKPNLFKSTVYWINRCYVWNDEQLLYHWDSSFDITINTNFDIKTLKMHDCDLLEDEKWYIYTWERITKESEKYIKENLHNYNKKNIKYIIDNQNVKHIDAYDFE